MERGDRLVRPARRREAAAVFHQPEVGAEHRVRRSRAEAHQHARLDQGQLGLEPRPAGGELAHAGRLMDPSLALLDELEVLHGVRDVEPRAGETDFGQHTVEDLAGWTDERRALAVFLISGLLAHEHDPRVGWAQSEDGLRGVAIEIAPGAFRGGGPELGQARARRNELRGALTLALR